MHHWLYLCSIQPCFQFVWFEDIICFVTRVSLHLWLLACDITQPHYVTLISFSDILLLYLNAFTVGLGGARQFPGIVRNLTVQGFQTHVFVYWLYTCMWRACFYVLDGFFLHVQDNSTVFFLFSWTFHCSLDGVYFLAGQQREAQCPWNTFDSLQDFPSFVWILLAALWRFKIQELYYHIHSITGKFGIVQTRTDAWFYSKISL